MNVNAKKPSLKPLSGAKVETRKTGTSGNLPARPWTTDDAVILTASVGLTPADAFKEVQRQIKTKEIHQKVNK